MEANKQSTTLIKLPEWRLLKCDSNSVSNIKQHFECSEQFARSLIALGLENQEDIKEFLEPDIQSWLMDSPFPSLSEGCKHLQKLVEDDKKICIHGDFDSDGIFATLVLSMALESVGANYVTYIPKRSTGHGLTVKSIEEIKNIEIDALITVDCGITAVEEAKILKEKGIELIITDHHLPDEHLPKALALINPQLDGDEKFKILSGAGVAFWLGIELCKHIGENKIRKEAFMRFMQNGLVCAAIATVADVVPLTGYNRTLVSTALKNAHEVDILGLRSLIHASGFKEKIRAEDLAFQVLPRLNAAQRMEKEAYIWELLNSKDQGQCESICKSLDELNQSRKELQKKLFGRFYHQCLENFEKTGVPEAIIIQGDDWPEGLSGLIASNLMEKFYRPVFVILFKDEIGLCSSRAPKGYHIKEVLDKNSELFIGFGGHECAAGFKIHRDKFKELENVFQQCFKVQREVSMDAYEKLVIVSEVNIPMLNDVFLKELERLEPFGKENEKPYFALRGILIDGNVKYIGADKSGVMIKFFKQGQNSIDSIGFSLANRLRELDHFGKFDIVFTVGRSPYNQKIQLHLKAIRQHQSR